MPEENDEMKTIKLQVEDLTCAGCAEDMGNVLRDKEGITEASVNFADGMVTIIYDPGVRSGEQVFSAVRDLGYKTKIISES